MRKLCCALACVVVGSVVAVGHSAAQTPAATPPVVSNKPTLLVLGDSLSAEYGLARGTGWVALLEKRLATNGYPYQVINASISGETTSGGQARLGKLLNQHHPKVVIIELGGNDALRGLALSASEKNFAQMITASIKVRANVLLVAMQIPPNYGAQYTERFNQLYGKLSHQYRLPKPPFLLQGIAERRELFQADQIHPTAQAQAQMLDNVWPSLRPLLKTNP